jgi:hypothetical protein
MSSTLFSKPVVAVNIPETKIIKSKFNYNFFTADERVAQDNIELAINDTPNIRKVPRYVTVDFTPGVILNEETASEESISIQDNIDKVMYEHDFSNLEFTGIGLQDNTVDSKLSQLLSGALSISIKTQTKAPAQPGVAIPKPKVNQNFGQSSLLDVAKLLNEFVDYDKKVAEAAIVNNDEAGFIFIGNEKKNIENIFAGIKKLNIATQVNNKIIYGILRTVVNDPQTIYSDEFLSILDQYKNIQDATDKKNQKLDIQQYDTITQFVSAVKQQNPNYSFKHSRKIVGYIADKLEVTNDGYTKKKPIIIENKNLTQVFDPNIKYGTTYSYQIRTIALVSFEAVQLSDNNIEEIYTVSALISSKPSERVIVKCIEEIPPPPPADFKVSWDYNYNRPRLTWNFPITTQRDVKQFQIFRRKNINLPFELIRQYDFDNSAIKTPNGETPNSFVVDTLAEPKTHFIDYEFNRNDTYIYSLCCLDAHGLSSNYSTQFEVKFDSYANKIVTKIISNKGAPKSLPNLYLQEDAFIDTIKISGFNSVKVYFEPEIYQYYSENDISKKDLLSTDLNSGKENYILQLINTDLQEQKKIKINILDERGI